MARFICLNVIFTCCQLTHNQCHVLRSKVVHVAVRTLCTLIICILYLKKYEL